MGRQDRFKRLVLASPQEEIAIPRRFGRLAVVNGAWVIENQGMPFNSWDNYAAIALRKKSVVFNETGDHNPSKNEGRCKSNVLVSTKISATNRLSIN